MVGCRIHEVSLRICLRFPLGNVWSCVIYKVDTKFHFPFRGLSSLNISCPLGVGEWVWDAVHPIDFCHSSTLFLCLSEKEYTVNLAKEKVTQDFNVPRNLMDYLIISLDNNWTCSGVSEIFLRLLLQPSRSRCRGNVQSLWGHLPFCPSTVSS